MLNFIRSCQQVDHLVIVDLQILHRKLCICSPVGGTGADLVENLVQGARNNPLVVLDCVRDQTAFLYRLDYLIRTKHRVGFARTALAVR